MCQVGRYILLYHTIVNGGTDRREILHDGTHWSWTGLLPIWAVVAHGT